MGVALRARSLDADAERRKLLLGSFPSDGHTDTQSRTGAWVYKRVWLRLIDGVRDWYWCAVVEAGQKMCVRVCACVVVMLVWGVAVFLFGNHFSFLRALIVLFHSQSFAFLVIPRPRAARRDSSSGQRVWELWGPTTASLHARGGGD